MRPGDQQNATSPPSPRGHRVALAIGVTLMVAGLSGSCLFAPFLFPYLQLGLLITMLPAVLFGLLGGWRRNWWITLGLTLAALAAYVVYNVRTDPYGYGSMYDTYVNRQPPAGFMYFHSWSNLYQMTIFLLCPAVALTVHGLINFMRYQRWDGRVRMARCGQCAYELRGLTEGRCPECGTPFDPAEVAEALRWLDGQP